MTDRPTSSAVPMQGMSRAAGGPEEDRSVLSTLNEDGSRRWLNPRISRGRFLTARRGAAYGLIALFALVPLVRVHGKPIVLLDIISRRFHIFGGTFYATDTLLLALLVLGIVVGVLWITALLGRVWCGWACPQTVYMEFVFRPIERLFEGAPGRSQGKKTGMFGLGKSLKHMVYFGCSMLLAHTFLAYFVTWEQLGTWVFGSPRDHPLGFGTVMLVTAGMMVNFGYFREQVCLVACPYGRLQSVMLDPHSMIVRYDSGRGEPRGAITAEHRGVSLPVLAGGRRDGGTPGDCIDCAMCVTTCPTGIDIRRGLQMECIGCAQCIDACDTVMDKIHRPRGLIRYSSEAAARGERFRLLRPRAVLYPGVLLGLIAIFALTLVRTGIADVTLMRGLGQPFTITPSQEVSNPARVKIVNRLEREATFTISIDRTGGLRLVTETPTVIVGPGQTATIPARILAPAGAFRNGRAVAALTVSGPEQFSCGLSFTLLGPSGEDHDPTVGHPEPTR
jgi:cytochrome c oxidase accessory protein FixG